MEKKANKALFLFRPYSGYVPSVFYICVLSMLCLYSGFVLVMFWLYSVYLLSNILSMFHLCSVSVPSMFCLYSVYIPSKFCLPSGYVPSTFRSCSVETLDTQIRLDLVEFGRNTLDSVWLDSVGIACWNFMAHS